jgi:hypothetical protein
MNDFSKSGGAFKFLALSMMFWRMSELEALLVMGVLGLCS